jgi:hypothetical protein
MIHPTAAMAIRAALALAVPILASPASAAEPVTIDTFKRAETDLYFGGFVEGGSFGTFVHVRQPTPIDEQGVIRMNRDTLYSYGIADLGAGPVTVTLPDPEGRFMSLQVIDQDHYTPTVVYDAGSHTFTEDEIGTRYVAFLMRTFVDPGSPEDIDAVHRLQDAMTIEQGEGAAFEVPDWDTEQAARLREALNDLAAASGGIDSARMFGPQDFVDPVQHLIGTAAGWGGNPASDAYYVGVTPDRNDGDTVYRLTVGDVPVDGFWSISVYNEAGFFEENDLGRYSLNNVTAERSEDGTVEVRFGGCDAGAANCLPTTSGWNYLVRLYRPQSAILDGTWSFPVAEPVE